MPEILQNPSPNFGERKNNAKIEHIILHYTDMVPCEGALKRLCDPDHQVSAHYLIHQDGKIYQLVADHMRA
ncbi:MAG: N-acetylmuramoyl-L-alanine amidase, partial [Alphaproteobacteria bacterium]|nr:N-acetylmuramoyl-L-alanine amidase [Alphaproteobacteria bacterium]